MKAICCIHNSFFTILSVAARALQLPVIENPIQTNLKDERESWVLHNGKVKR
jgi:hypothetical protein